MKKLLLLILLSIAITACEEKKPFDAEQARLNLIDARENTMPIITEMLDTRREILTKVGNVNALSEKNQEIIKELGDEMNAANVALMTWINDFNRDIDKYMGMENGAPEQKKWMEDMMDRLEDAVEGIEDATEHAKKVSSKF